MASQLMVYVADPVVICPQDLGELLQTPLMEPDALVESPLGFQHVAYPIKNLTRPGTLAISSSQHMFLRARMRLT
jgi:hypothetical protein